MKAFFLYIAAGAIAINVVGNAMQHTADAIQQRQADRVENLCKVNGIYCES